MLYRDLIQFEPIETVIQIREADRELAAQQLVRTYVISDRMADQLANVAIPQLQFLTPHDNKGVLIVGNYGTGKSHLMSVLSAVAEYPGLVSDLNHPRVVEAAQSIAGRFKVLRVEIGASTRSLRDTLLQELELALERWGTPFSFPAANMVTNNKDALIAAVAAFQHQYPDQGVLLVVDELLDFLRTREERDLILDLGFLRELGEVAALTPFRFLGGLQESLFDSPRFSFVAEQLRRVRDRFEQLRIAREDIAFVVSHRLLRKNDEQLARVTEHLRRFTHLYSHMAERIEEFAQLFPIHPAYIETFEGVHIAEKREVLKTFSEAMRALLDKDVPSDQPGLISYDHYWDVLRDNASMRGLPGVSEVIEKSNVLEGRIKSAYTRPMLLTMALRIIQGLSVHRLTTSDIHDPVGATTEELRDHLCLYVRMPEESAGFLLDQVEVALREIVRTVSGQYISRNDTNGQYYLDVKKDIDFDAKIRERGDFMEESDLNRYFFDALRQVLNLSDTTYVNGHRIWFYEVPWPERNVTRPGYLFFGAPDERSTAQPPRDFYVYLLPPFLSRPWHDEQRSDEVVFQLTGLDPIFEDTVRLYAGARALSNESPTHRDVYAGKADTHLRRLRSWLQERLTGRLQVIYLGVQRTTGETLAQLRASANQPIEEILRFIASRLLAPDFEERYPAYPGFSRLSQPISEAARPADAQEAIRHLAGRSRTSLAAGVLEGLELLDVQGAVRPYQSRYAKGYLELLQSKPEGQVVNRGELIELVAMGLQPVEKDVLFHLEPEWVAVALVALVYNGDLVLETVGRETLDSGNLERAATIPLSDLVNFRHYGRPRTMPLNLWIAVFEALGLPAGLIRDENTREEAIRRLQEIVQSELSATAGLEGRLHQGVHLWNGDLFTDRYTLEVESGVVVGTDASPGGLTARSLLPDLRAYKQFLEELARFNTVGRLRNLQLSLSRIEEARGQRGVKERVSKLLGLVDQIQPLTTYLAEAQANLPGNDSWSHRAAASRDALLEEVRRFGKGETARPAAALVSDLEGLKREYVAAYAGLHRRLALGPEGDDRRQRLYRDERVTALDALSAIDLLNGSELETWKRSASALPTCREFHEGAISAAPTCPYCHLRPSQQPMDRQAKRTLDQLDSQLDGLLKRWRQALKTNLQSEVAQRSLAAMSAAERTPVELFMAQTDEDPVIPSGFVPAAIQALRGIEAIALPADGLMEALKAGGLPCTVEELQRRFAAFVGQAMRGHDARNTRLTLE